ncbi:MAG: T9SS type A sorting domain-containing protein [Bacteroidetes bacterium]|nr:MAG: T9SS type A sorting domain-containing protein [Bacteroidota bacterium]
MRPLILTCLSLLVAKSVFAQCGAATLIGTITPTTTSQNTGTVNSGRPYWEFAATAGCTYTFNTCNVTSGIDTYMRLYNSSGVLQTDNDDFCSTQSSITWTCSTSGTYRIQVTRYSYSPLDACATLNANTFVTYVRSCPSDPPINDLCSGATQLSSETVCYNWTIPTTATNSGVSNPSCLTYGSVTVIEDIWYKFTATSTVTSIDVTNIDRHMAFQVYSGTCGSLTPVSSGCSDVANGPGLESVQINTVNGQNYFLRIMRTNGTGVTNSMTGTLAIRPRKLPHSQLGILGTATAMNDRASAPTITMNGAPNTCADVGTLKTAKVEVRNLGASTMDNYIASESCFLNSHSSSGATYKNMWFKIEIPAGSSIQGLYFYSTIDRVCPQPSSSTNLRTAYINVYTGTSSCTPVSVCSSPWENVIASYNLSPPHIEPVGTERVDVTANTTYYIEVWTTSFATDPNFNFDIHIVPLGARPVNELCTSADQFVTNEIGCNLGARPGCNTFLPGCYYTVENSVFYTFNRPAGSSFQIQILNVNCEGGAQDLQTSVFQANTLNCNTNLVSANLEASACITGNYTYNITNSDPEGTTYILWFDGNAGAACSWGITVLPVELKQFNINCESDGSILSWSTESEQNNDFYTIEKSLDGVNFEKIAEKEAVGFSTVQMEYEFQDYYPERGVSYYRLSQTDFDGVETILGTLSTQWPCQDASGEMVLYPNPTDGDVQVVFSHDIRDEFVVETFNAIGQSVFDPISGAAQQTGSTLIKLNSQELPAGVYMVRVKVGEKIYTEKLVRE